MFHKFYDLGSGRYLKFYFSLAA